jgi:hypothetical protein
MTLQQLKQKKEELKDEILKIKWGRPIKEEDVKRLPVLQQDYSILKNAVDFLEGVAEYDISIGSVN